MSTNLVIGLSILSADVVLVALYRRYRGESGSGRAPFVRAAKRLLVP
jgi:hypothetical protein